MTKRGNVDQGASLQKRFALLIVIVCALSFSTVAGNSNIFALASHVPDGDNYCYCRHEPLHFPLTVPTDHQWPLHSTRYDWNQSTVRILDVKFHWQCGAIYFRELHVRQPGRLLPSPKLNLSGLGDARNVWKYDGGSCKSITHEVIRLQRRSSQFRSLGSCAR